MSMSKQEIGLKRLNDILGGNGEKIVESFKKISPDFANYILEFCYGEIYNRPGLSDKSRELALVSSLITQGNTGVPLKAHINGMLNVGWTQTEVLELIIFMACSVGFPSAVDALKTAAEVFEARKN